MKILVLTSRYTASRDIIGEDFGRQVRLFEAMKGLGHDMDFLCADYNKLETKNTKLHGINVMIRPFSLAHFFGFLNGLDNALKKKKYDFLFATSDPLWGILGNFFAKRHKIKFIYDLHDNYETYASYKIPFLGHFDRKAIRSADIVTTVSFALKEKISRIRKPSVFVVQNGVDLKLFRPMDRAESRKRLKLPLKARIIGYTGSLQKSLGLDMLIDVFGMLGKEIPDLNLLLVGRLASSKTDRPDIKKKGIITFDALKQEDVALAINAADVAVIPSPSNEFTKYCFPYKCVEYMACNTPIVATALSDVSLMLKSYKGSLCAPDSREKLYDKIKKQLGRNKINYRKSLQKQTWESMASRLDNIMRHQK